MPSTAPIYDAPDTPPLTPANNSFRGDRNRVIDIVGYIPMRKDRTMQLPDDIRPSRAASLAALGSVLAVIIGVGGQLAVSGSVLFGMLAGFGLATLAAIVLAHET
jgi:hypothetical protein